MKYSCGCEYFLKDVDVNNCGARNDPSNPGLAKEGIRPCDGDPKTCKRRREMSDILASISG